MLNSIPSKGAVMASKGGGGPEQDALEQALPSLLDKLGELRAGLPANEQSVLDDIIVSAANHSRIIDPDDITQPDIRYYKPMSVHVTAAMRDEMIAMPERFGITPDDAE
jgi:hypothetical protein